MNAETSTRRRPNRWLWPLATIGVAMVVGLGWFRDHRRLQQEMTNLQSELRIAKDNVRRFSLENQDQNQDRQASIFRLLQERDRLELRLALKREPITVTGTTADGKPFDWSPYRGKVVLLHCWSASCNSCENDFPFVKSFYETLHPRGLEVVGLSQDEPQKREQSLEYLRKQDVPWVNLIPSAAGDRPHVNGKWVEWPMTLILVDRDGTAVEVVDHIIEDDRRKNAPGQMFTKLDEILQVNDLFPAPASD